ncbi:FRAS1-related extracellular matrix protein 1-like [Limulus polyphemus]|uniref:FRAS1-related extracellular matrix protein 1-like n=1 Tax=Limulus polyphemus TaxID=6850 RepID=A0ABM1BPG7_LIMPO|nr:FRAS1-related extracellular matrix protein 1-like [Limulus polyphemus]
MTSFWEHPTLWLVFGLVWILKLHSCFHVQTRDIDVAIGRGVFLQPQDLIFHGIGADDICRLEVVSVEPMSQRVGVLEPKIFDCFFKPDRVRYTHFGLPFIKQDIIKLYAYKLSVNNTISRSVTLTINIKSVKFDVTVVKAPLVVEDFFGVSEPISQKNLEFLYNKQDGASCKVRFSVHQSSWPAYGQIVIGHQRRFIDVIKVDCDDLVQVDLQYEHLKPPTPDTDYILLLVETSDPHLNGGGLVTEWVTLPVEIKSGFPNLPPKASFSSTFLMAVQQFILTPITPNVLSASDGETPKGKLIFNVSTELTPDVGFIVHLSDHTQPIYSFRQSDIENGDIAYKPSTKPVSADQTLSIKFIVLDAEFKESDPVELHIFIRSSTASFPRVSVSSGLVLLEGQSRPLLPQNLEVVDKDNIEEVQVFVSGGLKHGQLKVGGKSYISFTLADLIGGHVVYHHDDSDSSKDTIHLRVTDKSQSTLVAFPVTVLPKDDDPPVLTVNVGLQLVQGGLTIITPTLLNATDQDSEDQYITYVVKKKAEFGVLWKKHVWEVVGVEVQNFTQGDINNELIYYHHLGNKGSMDSFEVILMDGSDPPNKSFPYKVLVGINPASNEPPQRHPNCSLHLEVKEDVVGILTQDMLHYVDLDSKPSEVVFTVTSSPRFIGSFALSDAGKFVSVAGQVSLKKNFTLPSLTYFTQEEIRHHKVAYMPPASDVGPNPQTLQVVMSVSDRQGNTVTGQFFNITILPVDNQAPKLYTGHILVQEGSSTLLSTNEVSVHDLDTLSSKLMISLFTVPLHGSLLRGGQVLRVGDLLSLDDILTLQVEYSHDGSESISDSFTVGVSDGKHFVSGNVLVDVEPVNDQNPVWKRGLKTEVTVNEGGSVVLTPDVLAASDLDSDDLSLIFSLTEAPYYGSLMVGKKATNRFMQRNVTKGEVLYVHNGREIGEKGKQDALIFVVSDRPFPRLFDQPKHTVTVLILPMNNRPPQIHFQRAVLVEEGQQAVIDDKIISVSDADTQISMLRCFVTKEPDFGFLENTRPLIEYETERRGRVAHTFLFEDVQAGYIYYIQSKHKGLEPEADFFEVMVSDGVFNTSSVLVSIKIIPVNDEVPLVTLKNLTVPEGGLARLDPDTLTVTDRDFPGNIITVRIETAPKSGSLVQVVHLDHANMERDLPFVELTLDGFYQNVHYRHSGNENFFDWFTLAVSDGKNTVSKTAYVSVTPLNDEPPRVFKNIGGEVDNQGNLLLSSALLLAIDEDTPPEQLIYHVTTPPNLGILQKLQRKWLWTVLDPMNFSQEEISNNLIRYSYQGLSTSLKQDSFQYSVGDGVHQTKVFLFPILLADFHNRTTEFRLNGTVVPFGSHVTVSRNSFGDVMEDLEAEDFFIVTRTPQYGHLEISSSAGEPIGQFSLQELLDGQVIYNHTVQDIQTELDSFDFMVVKGNREITGIFPIKISPIIDYSVVLTTLKKLKVFQNGTAVISSNHLEARGDQLAPEDVHFIVVEYPHFGILLKNNRDIVQNFSQEDINKGNVSYKKESSNFTTSDNFVFQLSSKNTIAHKSEDGKQTNFRILCLRKILENGEYGFTLTTRNLMAVGEDSNVEELQYELIGLPQNGFLRVKSYSQPVTSFTQLDVNEKNVRYVIHDSKVNAMNDSFTFRIVSNGKSEKEHSIVLHWSVAQFSLPEYRVCENQKYFIVEILRRGSLNGSSFVTVLAIDQTAQAKKDYIPDKANIIQFDPGTTIAVWNIEVIQDGLVEAPIEQIQIVLFDPINTVINDVGRVALISIHDESWNDCQTTTGKNSGVAPDWSSIPKNIPDTSGWGNYPLCSSFYTGLLHFNPTIREFQECNGEDWVLWKPTSKDSSHKLSSKEVVGMSPVKKIDSSSKPPGVLLPMTNRSSSETPPHEFHYIASFQRGSDVQHRDTVLSGGLPKNNDNKVVHKTTKSHSSECPDDWRLYGNLCYGFLRGQISGKEALNSCRKRYDGQVAAVQSLEHNKWLLQLAEGRPFWIGLQYNRRNARWGYKGLSEVPFVNWKPRFPKVSRKGRVKHRCVLVRGTGQWINRNCAGHHHNIVCSRPPG